MIRARGSVVLKQAQADALVDGGTIEVPNVQFRGALARANRGDLFWVAEPHVEIQSYRSAGINIHEIVPGWSPLNIVIPLYIRPHFSKCRMRARDAARMYRSDSRFTLAFIEPLPRAQTRCAVHKAHISELMNGKAT